MKLLLAVCLFAFATILPSCATGSGSAAEPGTPVNANCVFQTDEAIDPTVTVTFEETTIGFCCNKCKTKFEAMTVEEKVEIVKQATPGGE